MRSNLLLGAFVLALACGSPTTPTPNGTVVARFDASQSKWPALERAAPKAENIKEGTFDAASAGGAKVSIRYKTGVVQIEGKPTRVPLEATVTVTDSGGFAVSGGFSDGPLHYAGMPEDVRALDFDAMVTRGTRSCAGTRYENDEIRVRVTGDGTATLLPARAPAGSVAPSVTSP